MRRAALLCTALCCAQPQFAWSWRRLTSGYAIATQTKIAAAAASSRSAPGAKLGAGNTGDERASSSRVHSHRELLNSRHLATQSTPNLMMNGARKIQLEAAPRLATSQGRVICLAAGSWTQVRDLRNRLERQDPSSFTWLRRCVSLAESFT